MENYGETNVRQQRDLVLAPNEFCFLQNETNGQIRTYSGPTTVTISQQDKLVQFDVVSKQFKPISFDNAKQKNITAPEGWYAVLKNPAVDNVHPEPGKASNSASLRIGNKINIPGPVEFSLFPGQMCKVVRGHRLTSNQYLMARVYDDKSAKQSIKDATIVDADGKAVAVKAEDYHVGQLLIIKGTEVSFYIPPTGIEVVPIEGTDMYVRDAVTLENLEYAILKDENGQKRYVHGPQVVFPEPTEKFVTTPNGGEIFRALELSPISGIYVKVVEPYEEDGKKFKKGDELFITGKEQMIYYPRVEHAMIQYDGKYMHHAIAIPMGEGRYILNRLTGDIKTVQGPAMYLPDPRTEVVVHRKLTDNECALIYPGNAAVLNYNRGLSEKKMERDANSGNIKSMNLDTAYSTSNQEKTLAIFEANSQISRGVSYTKPRTITLDTRFDGVVTVKVWTGYAVNVISNTGNREVVVGPATRLLDYNETLEAVSLSSGKPKNTDNLITTAYLKVKNNKVSDIVTVETSDFVKAEIKLSYSLDFLDEYKDKWFNVDNYVKLLTDRYRSMLKKAVKAYNVNEFYSQASDIVRNAVIGEDHKGRLFEENGMMVNDVDVLNVALSPLAAKLIEENQTLQIKKTLELSNALATEETNKELVRLDKENADLKAEAEQYKRDLDHQAEQDRLNKQKAIDEKNREINEAKKKAEQDMQVISNAIQAEQLKRDKASEDQKVEAMKAEAEIEKAKQAAYAETVAKMMEAISPDLVAALQAKANADLLSDGMRHMSPYALAEGESVSDVVNKLLRGTPLENSLKDIAASAK